MARKYKLRNGDVVEVAPGQEYKHSVGVVHEGKVIYLLYPPVEEGCINGLPRGGVYGEAFDAVAMDDPIDHHDPFGEFPREQHSDLLDALRYAAGFINDTKNGEIDLMNTNEPAFRTAEYYHNTDVTALSDDQIFTYVKNIDAKLKELAGLEGAAADAHTARLNAERTNLLRVVDARYPAESE